MDKTYDLFHWKTKPDADASGKGLAYDIDYSAASNIVRILGLASGFYGASTLVPIQIGRAGLLFTGKVIASLLPMSIAFGLVYYRHKELISIDSVIEPSKDSIIFFQLEH